MIDNVIPFVHHLLGRVLRRGDCAVDGTAGHGHDTLFLAQTVGSTGSVWAFDVQESAIQSTQSRLESHHMQSQVHLIHRGHEFLSDYVSQPIQAAIFNFGYLPGGDKSLTTQEHTSLSALTQSLNLLTSGGIVSAVLYSGHPQGAIECRAIEQWAHTIAQSQYTILRYQFANRPANAPYALIFEKM